MREAISKAMKAALRNKDQTALSAIRLISAALKDREKALLIKEEENMAEKMRLAKEREEMELLLELQKKTRAEQESAKLKEAEGLKIETEEKNKTKVLMVTRGGLSLARATKERHPIANISTY